jgi:Kef-type K+ transport system membrane component KefB
MEISIYYKFILTFVLVLMAARITGEIFERYLKQPPVLGELIAGVIIGPFALGAFAHDPIILNFATVSAFGVEHFNIMEIISEIAVIVLLFEAGVETDVRSFLQQGVTGALVAVAGVILPFLLGFGITWWLFPEEGIVGWLFMGAVLTATSIGITVRILMEMGKLQTKEGTTILVGAVIDDIIGIVVLSIVVAISGMLKGGAEVDGGAIALDALKIGAIGFAVWFALLMVGVRFNKYISRFFLNPFKKSGTAPIFALIVGFLIAWAVTKVQLHPVVGAYVAGLMFSACGEKEEIIEKTRPIMLFLAPFFFAYCGMQVNVPLLIPGLGIACLLLVAAILGKMIGCYIPARFQGKLSHNSAMVVGIGMVPRGEVGLIVASVGLLAGAIEETLYGAAVFVSLLSTLVTPAMLKPFLKRMPLVGEPEVASSNPEPTDSS